MRTVQLNGGKIADFVPLGQEGMPIYQNAEAFRAALSLNPQVGTERVNHLAIPKISADNNYIDWYVAFPPKSSDGQYKIISWQSASPIEKQNALAKLRDFELSLKRLGNDLARREQDTNSKLFRYYLLGENSVQNLPAIHFPSNEYIYIVDDIPVITFWGFCNKDSNLQQSPFMSLQQDQGSNIGHSNFANLNSQDTTSSTVENKERQGYKCVLPVWLLWLLGILFSLLFLLVLLWFLCKIGLFNFFNLCNNNIGVFDSFSQPDKVTEQVVDVPNNNELVQDNLQETSQPVPEDPSKVIETSTIVPQDTNIIEQGITGSTVVKGEPQVDVHNINPNDNSSAVMNMDESTSSEGIPNETLASEVPLTETPISEEPFDEASLGEVPHSEVPHSEVPHSEIPQGEMLPNEVLDNAIDSGVSQGAGVANANQDQSHVNEQANNDMQGLSPVDIANNANNDDNAKANIGNDASNNIVKDSAINNQAPDTQQGQSSTVLSNKDRLSFTAQSLQQNGVKVANGKWTTRSGLMDAKDGRPLRLGYNLNNGEGQVIVERSDGVKCVAKVNTSSNNNQLNISSAQQAICPDNTTYQIPKVICSSDNNGQVRCQGHSGNSSFPIVFYNQK